MSRFSRRPGSSDETSRNPRLTAVAAAAAGTLDPFVGTEAPKQLRSGRPKCLSAELQMTLAMAGIGLVNTWASPLLCHLEDGVKYFSGKEGPGIPMLGTRNGDQKFLCTLMLGLGSYLGEKALVILGNLVDGRECVFSHALLGALSDFSCCGCVLVEKNQAVINAEISGFWLVTNVN